MSDAARGYMVKHPEHWVTVDEIIPHLDAFAAEQTAAKDAEIAALERTVDDWRAKWADAVERTGSLDALTERGATLVLAQKILDRPSADPDDDLAMLSRQLLRAVERAEQAEALVGKMRAYISRLVDEADRLPFANIMLSKAGQVQLSEGRALLADPLGQRLAEEQRAQWKVVLTCCGRDAGSEEFDAWEKADAFRQAYTSGAAVDPHGYSDCRCTDGGHRRSGVIVAAVERARGQG